MTYSDTQLLRAHHWKQSASRRKNNNKISPRQSRGLSAGRIKHIILLLFHLLRKKETSYFIDGAYSKHSRNLSFARERPSINHKIVGHQGVVSNNTTRKCGVTCRTYLVCLNRAVQMTLDLRAL